MTGTVATFTTADARLVYHGGAWVCILRNLNETTLYEVTGRWGTPDGALREALRMLDEGMHVRPEIEPR